jgi:hypothetical protein
MPPVAAPMLSAPHRAVFARIFPALLLLPGWMYCTDRPEPPPVNAKRIIVIPQTVFARPDDLFVLRARVLDQYRGFFGAADLGSALQWTPVDSRAAVISTGADSAVIKAVGGTPGSTDTVRVMAMFAELRDSAAIIIGPMLTQDVVHADYRSNNAPDVALLSDTLPPHNVSHSVVAFVRFGVLGNLTSGKGEVVRFSTDQGFQLHPVTFQPSREVVDLRTSPAATTPILDAPLNPSVTLWITSNDNGATDDADGDIAYAQKAFARQRTGLRIQFRVRKADGRGSYLLDAQPPHYTCPDLKLSLLNLGVPSSAAPNAIARDSLNILYVDQIFKPAATPGDLAQTWAGYSCPWDGSAGTVILVSVRDRSTSTLAHELGHAFGLLVPDYGHTDYDPGFSHSNLMWHMEEDETRAPRSGVTLGQAFRMNVDSLSWIFRTGLPTWPRRQCDSLYVGKVCPPLSKDIVPLP